MLENILGGRNANSDLVRLLKDLDDLAVSDNGGVSEGSVVAEKVRGIEEGSKRLGELAGVVTDDSHLVDRNLHGLGPRIGHKRVVHGHHPDLGNALVLELLESLNVAGNVLGGAGGREGAGDTDNDVGALSGDILHVELARRSSLSNSDCGDVLALLQESNLRGREGTLNGPGDGSGGDLLGKCSEHGA